MTSTLTFSLGLVALLVLFAVARIVYPAKDQHGFGVSRVGATKEQSQTIVVATYNVQTGKNMQGDRDIDRAATTVASADVVGIQEVYGAGWLNKLGLGRAQTIALAEPGGFGYLFAATRYRWWREQRGNVLLSKLPVEEWWVKMLPDQSRKSPRNMVIANVPWQGTSITIINTHLHTGRGRRQQLEAVLTEFNRHPIAVLMGDFNSTLDEEILADAVSNPEITDAIDVANITQTGHSRIDWILTRGLTVKSGHSEPKGISDHPYYQVELALE